MNVVKFKYFDDFHCLGPDCKDTCCKDWHIHITKREYLDYKKMKCSPELRRLLDDSFKRIKTISNDAVYAEVKFNEDNKCPLLGKDSLCMLQKELGAMCFPAYVLLWAELRCLNPAQLPAITWWNFLCSIRRDWR